MIDLILELGLGYATYSEDMSPDFKYQLNVGYDNVYFWSDYEEPDIKFRGQPLATTDIIGVGLGARKKWNHASAFIEFGYGFVDADVKDHVQQEIIYTELVDNHDVEGRNIPFPSRGYQSSYEIDDALIARIGVGIEVTDQVTVKASWKAMKADQEYAVWDAQKREAGGGYWREDTTYDFSAFEFGIYYTY